EPPSSRRTTESRLAELKSLHADGLITDDDYDRRRAEILNAV
ncbi:MAG: Short C-terminal domain, partial [Frankiaceae bacterium]|nr:Short C-terminal domain [Frankiaceae bacterium]MDQ1699013.1 Short C-terminal domain [Frankiaceae bacterium]